MSRKSTLEPRWLVSMLTAWAKYCARSWDNGLGYPDRCVFLTERVGGSKNRSYYGISLNAYDREDYEKISVVMHDMQIQNPFQYAAVTMYYKPGSIHGLREQGYPLGDSTYYYRLRAGHKWLKERLQDVESKHVKKQQEKEIAEMT